MASIAARPPLVPVVERAKSALQSATAANFDGQHDPDGGAWAPPAQPLHRSNRGLYDTRTRRGLLLNRTMALRRSVDAALQGAEATDTGFTVDPAWIWYGDFHDQGTSRMPARQFEGWTDRAVEAVADDAAEAVVERLLEAIT